MKPAREGMTLDGLGEERYDVVQLVQRPKQVSHRWYRQPETNDVWTTEDIRRHWKNLGGHLAVRGKRMESNMLPKKT